MIRSILMLGASLAVVAVAPATAQTERSYSSEGATASLEQSSSETGYVESGLEREDGHGGGRIVEGGAILQQSQESSSESQSYEQRAYASEGFSVRRRAGDLHHTTDARGFLTWANKVEDESGDVSGRLDFAGGGRGPGCPVAHGERVLSCQYIPFEPVVRDEAVHIDDEDFAYEGSAGPIVAPDGGGGGGGGGGFAEGGGSAFAGASAGAYASASVSVSGSVSFHGRYGGHYGGGGYHGGGHGGWGGHMSGGGGWGGGHKSSGCGCSKK